MRTRRAKHPERVREIGRNSMRKKRMDGTSKVYFIQAGLTGPIKIGCTRKKVSGRMAELQAGNHETLRILKEIPGDYNLERELHQKFKHLQIRGEWFQPTTELILFVTIASLEVIYPSGS